MAIRIQTDRERSGSALGILNQSVMHHACLGRGGESGAFVTGQLLDLEDMRTLLPQFRIGFWATPEDISVEGRVVEVTFHVWLCGKHRHSGNEGSPCRSCVRVLRVLLDLADALVPIERERLSTVGRTYERRVRYTQQHELHHGVALAIEMKIHRPFEEARNGWALEFLDQVRTFLLQKGCQEGGSYEEAEPEGTPPEVPNRFQNGAAYSTSLAR